MRNTLLSDECDAYFGLPYDQSFMSQSVALTRPFLDMGYAVIAPRALGLSAVDALRGRRVAVQFSSSPQLLLSERGGYELVTFREPEGALDALARGEVDAAFVWGPVAGYYNKTKLGGAYQVSPVAGPGLQWQPRSACAGTGRPARVHRTGAGSAGSRHRPPGREVRLSLGAGNRVRARRRHRRAAPAPTEGVRAGRSLFNQHCSHCHAPNAMSPELSRDLRRLRVRYGDKIRDVIHTTVKEGRPTKGMPTCHGAMPSPPTRSDRS